MPTISHAPLNSPHTAIKEVPIITELLSEVTESQLVTKTQLKVAEAATEPQPENISWRLPMVRQHMIFNAGKSNMESNREIELREGG